MTVSQNNSDKENTSEEMNLENNQSRRPLGKRRFIKFLKVVGLLVICFGLYTLWFIYSEPTIDIDYVSELNQINRPENYRQEDNAWPYYKKAMELYVEPNAEEEYGVIFISLQKRFSDFNDTEQRLVMGWIKKNEAAWQEFTAASLKPYFYIEYTLQETDDEFCPKLDVPTWNIDVGHLNDLRELSGLGTCRINVEIESGNIEQALDDCFTLLKVGTQLHKEKICLGELVGHQFDYLGCEGLLKVIFVANFSISQLKDIQERLNNIYESNYPIIDFEYEKITFLDVV
jgi:hypothetical protein